MAAANSPGGVMGKMISLQSLAVAVAATGMKTTDEPRLFRKVVGHSVLLVAVVAVLNVIYFAVFEGGGGAEPRKGGTAKRGQRVAGQRTEGTEVTKSTAESASQALHRK